MTQFDQHTRHSDGIMHGQNTTVLGSASGNMMIAWLLVLAVLLYVFRALSRPQVAGESATAAQEKLAVASTEVCDPRPTLAYRLSAPPLWVAVDRRRHETRLGDETMLGLHRARCQVSVHCVDRFVAAAGT